MFIKRMSTLILILLVFIFLTSCKNAYKDFNEESKRFESENNDYYVGTKESLILLDKREISYNSIFKRVLNDNNIKQTKLNDFDYNFISNHLFILGSNKNNSYFIGINLITLEETLYESFIKDKIGIKVLNDKIYLYQHNKQVLDIYEVIEDDILTSRIEFPIIEEDYYFFSVNNYLYRLKENDEKLIDAFNYDTLLFESDVIVNVIGEIDKAYNEGNDYYLISYGNIIDLYLNEELFKSFDLYELYETSEVGKQILKLLGKEHGRFELVTLCSAVNNEFILFVYYQKGFLMNKGLLGRSNIMAFKFDYLNETLSYIYGYKDSFKVHNQ